MNIAELNKRLKLIFEKVCGDRYDTTKCLWQMLLTDYQFFDFMFLLDDEFYTNFIDMELNIFQAMGFYNIAVYINHQQ